VDFGKRWKVPTSFGWVQIRLLFPADARIDSAPEALARRRHARLQLLFELSGSSHSALAALRDVSNFLSAGDGTVERTSLDREFYAEEARDFERLLDFEIAAERLELEWTPYWTDSLRERDLDDGPQAPPRALPPPEPETSFISVNLLDQDGKPVVGQACEIELPDGSKHSSITDVEGWARVRGFARDGDAKVTFPGLDELDFKAKSAAEKIIIPVASDPEDEREEPVEPAEALQIGDGPNFVELAFVDADGAPLSGVPFEVSTEDGKKVQGKTDANGLARVEGITPGEANVKLLESSNA
jgi:hypothetical protein